MLRSGFTAISLALACLTAKPAAAQDGISIQTHVLFYGDNTEFRNPFREGETIFGAAARVAVVAEVADRTTLTLGVFGNQRFGSEDSFEQVRPVIALTIKGARSTFTFGAFPASPHASAPGPDLQGPHGLLPPLQRETLAFDRPYEAGLQWTFDGGALKHDIWLNWQRLNTREHRERLDGGANGRLRLAGPFALPFQVHIVHEGGQLFASGPVADSVAGALGVSVSGAWLVERASLETYALASHFVPNRASALQTRSGAGLLTRAAGEQGGWRGHILFWRGDDYIKDEGDPNYLSIRRSGMRYRGVRDYAEAGLARTFRLGPRVLLQASGRLHRVERHYEYSYRVLAVASPTWKIK
jgi:hypothetical protein